MATLSAVSPKRAANAFTWDSAAGGGDEFLNTGRELLLINNGSGGAITLTVVTQQTVDGEAVADKAIVIGAGEVHLLGPFPQRTYNDSSEKVQLTYSAVTTVTVKVLKP